MNAPLLVIKRDGVKTEIFQPEKLHASIEKTCLAVKTPDALAEDIATRVTNSVMEWCKTHPESTSSDIRRQAHKALRPLHTDASYLYQHHKTII